MPWDVSLERLHQLLLPQPMLVRHSLLALRLFLLALFFSKVATH